MKIRSVPRGLALLTLLALAVGLQMMMDENT